jgi:DNA-binding MarR family transcriptional regulator
MENELLQLDNQLCFRLYSISRKMTKAYQPLLEKFTLTYPQYVVMLALFEAKHIDFKELSERVNLKTGTLTPIVQKLEQIGYVSRETNPDDHRKINVVLTETGRTLEHDIIEVPIGLAQRLNLSLEKYATLIDELDELSEMLDEALAKEMD